MYYVSFVLHDDASGTRIMYSKKSLNSIQIALNNKFIQAFKPRYHLKRKWTSNSDSMFSDPFKGDYNNSLIIYTLDKK